MDAKSHPFVSVVTPVYNGEKYLAECIESVLAQTYSNWEYVVINNSSTDCTLEIAQSYAQKDKRIRIVCTDKLLPIIENWNYALKQISAKSRYCKVVHADDWLFPTCLTKMVKVAEINSAVGLVGSYWLENTLVISSHLPYTQTVIPGRELARLSMRGDIHPFGSPTTVLLRSDLIRERFQNRGAFYNQDNLHADTEICYELLQNSDYGFVHQVLTFVRRHEESVTSLVVKQQNTQNLSLMGVLKKYGPIFLSRSEYEQREKERIKWYYTALGRSILDGRGKDYVVYQKQELEKLEYRFSWIKLISVVFRILLSQMLDVKKNARNMLRLLKRSIDYRDAFS